MPLSWSKAVSSSAPAQSESNPAPAADEPGSTRWGIKARVQAWIETLQTDPTADEAAAQERRARLLEELNRAVVESPDDMPIKTVIRRLNHHADD